jgi:hypothetical protein
MLAQDHAQLLDGVGHLRHMDDMAEAGHLMAAHWQYIGSTPVSTPRFLPYRPATPCTQLVASASFPPPLCLVALPSQSVHVTTC